jgi:hypothetical protein
MRPSVVVLVNDCTAPPCADAACGAKTKLRPEINTIVRSCSNFIGEKNDRKQPQNLCGKHLIFSTLSY